MWVDENAGDDPTGTISDAEDMTVTVEGEEYSADINMDINDDGVEDTAVLERPDGSVQAFVDEDGDGDADGYIQLDEQGDVVARASYDEASGAWVATPGGDDDTGDTQTSSSAMTADLPSGDVTVGAPTVDTNDDGVADTAVVEDDAGNTMMFTDVDGDGAADVVVVVTASGESTTYEHSGDSEWTRVGGSSDAGGQYSAGERSDGAGVTSVAGWGGADSADLSGVAHINPATGQWISPN